MEKYLVDSIHSEIILENKLFQELIYAKEMQRLKKIKQLGGAHFIFPSAEHSRYAHSLGVYELSRRILNKLQISISSIDRNAILSAALLHDLGHGPFSHTLEFLCKDYKHEDQTINIIMSKDTEINKILSKSDKRLPEMISKIINGTHEISWYVEIISNQLDADRMDYLTRDSKISGPNYGNVELNRLLNTIMIKNNHLVFHEKSIAAIENFLIGRYHMYEILYMHPKNIGFDYLLIFIFNRLRKLKNNKFNFKTNISLIDPIINSSLTINELYKLTDFSVTSVIVELSNEDDLILKNLVNLFIRGKVLKYVILKNDKHIKEFEQKFNKEEKGMMWDVASFKDNSLYNKYNTLSNESIKVVIDDKLTDISEVSKVISLIIKQEKNEKKVYGFYYE